MRINKHDTNGTKPLLGKGELGYDDYVAGGDVGRVYVGTGSENIALAEKSEIDSHVNRVDNPHSVTKTQVGLGNVDNTADANKNVLSATKWTTARTVTLSGDVTGSVSMDGTANVSITTTVQPNSVALGTDTTGNYVAGVTAGTGITVSGTAGEGWSPTVAITNVGTAGTYTKVTTNAQGQITSGTSLAATDIPNLDASKITSGTIDAARLPAYVDDVLEFANLASFPATGESGKIYVALDTNKTYRWSGSVYVYITSGAVDSVNGMTGVVTVSTITGNAGTATTLQTARTLQTNLGTSTAGSFNGSANITLGVTGTLPVSNGGTGVTTLTGLVKGNGTAAMSAAVAGTDYVIPSGSITGNAGTATTLQTARTIATSGDVVGTATSFNGSANITIPMTLANVGTAGTYTKVTTDAKGRVTAGATLSASDIPTLNQSTTGSAATLTTARTVQTNLGSTTSASFDGSANITPGVTGTLPVGNGGTGATTLTGIVKGNGTGAMTAATAGTDYVIPSGSISGNAGTATKLQTSRNIALAGAIVGSVNFDGSADVSISTTLGAQSFIQSSGLNTSWGATSGTSTGAVNAIMGTSSSATWLLSGTSGGVFRSGIQSLDSNGTLRLYSNSNYIEINGNQITGNISTASALATGRTIGMTGDVTWTSASFNGSANVTGTATLANSGVTAGTYKSVTVDAKGRVTAGTNPTTLSGYGITDAQTASRSTATFTTAANTWYRIATSAVAIGRNSGEFMVDWSVSGNHGSVRFAAACHYGQSAGVSLMQTNYSTYGTGGITEARLVYHTTEAGNYAYVEVKFASALTSVIVNVELQDALGWSLVTPSTAGSIPSGYTSYVHTFVPSAAITAGTYPKVTINQEGRVISGSAMLATDVPDLDASKITTGTLPVARGGTGVTTSTGTGSVVLSTSPTLTTPNIGVATGTSFNSITGLASAAPIVAGTAAVGTSTLTARQDHVHPAQTTITGNAGTATALQTARNIGGVSFNGTADITLPGVNAAGNQDTSGNAATATKLQTARLIGGVSFDGTTNIDLPGVNTTGNQSTTGNAATATVLQTARTIGTSGDVTGTATSFNGSANITIPMTLANSGVTAGTYSKVTVDAKGRVTAGAIPTMEDIPDATFKRSVRCATTANITLSGTQTIDGIAVVAGDRVLVKEQTTASQNGIYVVAAGAWTRSLDADSSSKIASALVAVDSGTANGGKLFDNDFKTTDTLGTTAMTWNTNLDDGSLLTAGSTSVGIVKYNGTTAVAGQFDGGTTTPTGTTRLNYGGNFYPTNINLVGSEDTTTASSHVFVEIGSDGYVRPKTLVNFKTEIFASPTLVTPNIGVATGTSFNSITGLSSTTPSMNGTAAVGTGVTVARADHVHPSDTTKVTKVASTDNAVVRFNGTTGDIQNSGVTIDDNDNIGSGTQTFNGFGGTGFKNYIINGNFDVWQRGASQTTNGYGSDDRWGNGNFGSTKTHSQIPTTDTERALFKASYFSRTVVASVAGASNSVNKFQYIEDVNKLAGKTVTLSFWAKANSAKNIAFDLGQIFGTGGTPSSDVTGVGAQLIALTTTWQKFTKTIVIPNIVGKTLGTDGAHTTATYVNFWFDAGSSLNSRSASLGQQSGTFDIAQVQLEEGSVATPFENRPYGLELSLCQRYCRKIGGMIDVSNVYLSSIILGGTARTVIMFNDPMRVAPSFTYYGNLANYSVNGVTGSSLVLIQASSYHAAIDFALNTNQTVGTAFPFRMVTTNEYFILSAEL